MIVVPLWNKSIDPLKDYYTVRLYVHLHAEIPSTIVRFFRSNFMDCGCPLNMKPYY